MKDVKVIIKGQENNPLVWDTKKHSLTSFLGSVLNAVTQISHKDTVSELSLNGVNFSFPLGRINPAKQALPIVESVKADNYEHTVIKLNFAGFVLTNVLKDIKDFSGLNISKDKNTNDKAQKAKNIVELIGVLTAKFKEAKEVRRNETANVRLICADTFSNIVALRADTKLKTEKFKALIAPSNISAAALKNAETAVERAAK
jgi:hypothetical protein